MQWPESKCPWLWMLLSQLEVCLCECVCVSLAVSMCEGLRTSARVSICARACMWGHVCVIAGGVYECISRVFVLLLSAASSCSGDCETMGTDITVGGRGVSWQAAGYPITSGPLLRLLPSTLPSSRIQEEVSRGQAGSSLCHYPSITCRPLCADNRTFSSLSSPFTLGTLFSSLWALTLFLFLLVWLCLYDFHIFLPSICSPVLAPFLAIYLSLFALLIALHHSQFPSVIFSHRFRKLRGPSLRDLLLSLQLISRLQQRYYTPTAAFTDRLEIEPNSFRGRSLLSF